MTNPFENIDVRLSNIENLLLDIKHPQKPKESKQLEGLDDIITRKELARLLKIDLSTIHLWCKKGRLNPLGIGNRVYFKRSEVEASLISIKGTKGGQNNA